ncbi:MAG: hypothetical protein JKY89_09065 [Immundisolibacteraceae bacterium]|nr:hypothetical protein [Immundisolibacteraceae bacterium]
MALPKKKTTKSKIDTAFEFINETSNNIQNSTKKLGRPKTIIEQRERISLHIKEDSLFRIERVLTFVKRARKLKGQKVDRSLLIDEAIQEWLEKHEKELLAS